MKDVKFTPFALDQLKEWNKIDHKTASKILDLIENAAKTPFVGLGKPEPLKHQQKGLWSRRITDEHRLVYEVTNDTIIILACKYHYEK